jgi:hypothetical protein
LLAAAAPASAAEWQRASLITPPFRSVPEVSTSASPAGETLVVWKDQEFLLFRTRVRGQDAGAPEALAEGVSRTFDLATDPQGNAVVAWVVSNGGSDNAILARFRPAGGQFGPVVGVSLEETQASQLQASLAPNGEVLLAWRDLGAGPGQRRLRAAARFAGAPAFGPVVALDTGEPQLRGVGIDDRGRALIAWSQPDGVRVARYVAGAGFVPPQTLITPGEELKGEVGLEVDPNGNAVLAFTAGPPDNRVTSAHVAAAVGHTTEPFDPPEIVSGPFARDLAVDIDHGEAGIVWRAASGRNSRVQVRNTLAEDLGETQTVSARNARAPDVVVTPNGRITAVWQRLTDRGRTLESSSNSADDGDFPAAERISSHGDVGAPVVETNARGEQFAAWIRRGRGLSRAESAKASSRTGRFTRVLPIFDGRVNVGEVVDALRLEPSGNIMQAVYRRRIDRQNRLFWDLSTYTEPAP